MRTALLCHHDDPLNRDVLPSFLATFSTLAGVMVITETRRRLWRRVAREWRRSHIRLLDVLAFRVYYRLVLSRRDRAWVLARRTALLARWRGASGAPVFHTRDPNSEAAKAFLESIGPDIVIARCKTLLRPEVFDVPSRGTFVIHPGICPEYRNAHGCFWALVNRDLGNVGATLLQVDEGVDTGPIFAYYRTDIDELHESHVVIQHRVVFDNLEAIRDDLKRLHARAIPPIDVSPRPSAAWGQPRLTDHLRWKRAARRVREPR